MATFVGAPLRRVVVLATIVVCGHVRVGAAQRPDSIARSIDRVFDNVRNTDGPGCAVGVSRGGKTVFEQGYGMANLETGTPIRPASIFHVASVSKQFTAAAILLLERDGKLSLDDDIRTYLPQIPDYGTPITIRHLLTHSSGLRDELELIFFARGRFEEDRITEADVMDLITRQTALNFTPGSEWLYSNTGYTLLALIVTRAAGKSLREFTAERIFHPLAMANTHFHDDFTMVVPGRTSAYESRPGADGPWRVAVSPYDIYGSGNLYTTVADLLKWDANFDHPIIGDATLFARMQAIATLATGDTSEYGLGLRRGRTYRGARVVESTGSDPGYQAYLGRYPDHSLAIAVICNAGSSVSPAALAHGVVDVVLGAALAAVPAPVRQAGVSVPIERVQSRVGVYLQPTTLAVVRLVVRDSQLAVAGGPSLVPLAANRFAVTGEAGDIVFADGSRGGYQRRIPGQRPVPFEWHEPISASAAVLAPYSGEYQSAELGGVVYRLTANDSTVVMRTGAADPFIAHIVCADTFVANGPSPYTIRFIRTGGRITGFEVTNARMRRLRFATKQ